MKQIILLLLHKNYLQAERLIRYFDGQCPIYIHVDKKSHLTVDLKKLSSLPGVKGVYSRYKVHWAGYSILKAEIFLMKIALTENNIGFFHLLSGQDYPLKPLNSFLAFFNSCNQVGFIQCAHTPNPATDDNTFMRLQHYILSDYIDTKSDAGKTKVWNLVNWQKRHGIKRRIPDQLEHLYNGSAWFSLRHDVINMILEYTNKHPSFYRRLRFTYVPEETYIASVVLNSSFRNSISHQNDCRAIIWNKPGIDCSPVNITTKNFKQLFNNPIDFFARKFDYPDSLEVMDIIDRYMLYPKQYDKTQTANLNDFNYDSGLCDAIRRLCNSLRLTSVCDFGCGPGWYVACLRDKGVSAIGYDINPHTSELSVLMCGGRDENCCATADLSESVDAGCRFDLVMALSVGEFIQPEREAVFIDNLRRHTAKYLIVSWNDRADDPSVVNPQPQSRIIERICGPDREFCYNEVATSMLREASSLKIHKKYLMVFQRI